MFMQLFRAMSARDDGTRTPRKILFSVHADPRRFPPDLWQQFRATAERRGELWIDALRHALEAYIATEPEP